MVESGLILTFSCAIIYFIISFISLIQILRILYYHHSLKSFQYAFLFIVLLWSLLRGIFLSCNKNWEESKLLIIYWLPNCFQFATFSLLTIFYIYQINFYLRDRKNWDAIRKPILIIWSILNLIFILLQLISVYYLCDNCGTEPIDVLKYNHLSISIAYILLILIFSYYSTVLIYTLYSKKMENTELSITSVIIISLLLLIVFITRCIYNFFAIYGIYSISTNVDDTGYLVIGWDAFLCFMFWEIFPTTCILLYFRTIPTTNIGGWWEMIKSIFNNQHDSEVGLIAAEHNHAAVVDVDPVDDDDETMGTTLTRHSSIASRESPPIIYQINALNSSDKEVMVPTSLGSVVLQFHGNNYLGNMINENSTPFVSIKENYASHQIHEQSEIKYYTSPPKSIHDVRRVSLNQNASTKKYSLSSSVEKFNLLRNSYASKSSDNLMLFQENDKYAKNYYEQKHLVHGAVYESDEDLM